MTIEVFDSDGDPNASIKFLRWRQANKILGHYLNENSAYGLVLHRARCTHVKMPKETDLGRNKKFCGATRTEVEGYANEHRMTYHRCKTCKPK